VFTKAAIGASRRMTALQLTCRGRRLGAWRRPNVIALLGTRWCDFVRLSISNLSA
jgi:hypothetical protein